MSATTNLRRLQNEVSRMQSQAEEYASMFKINMVGDDMYHWEVILFGPEESLYEGYQFKLDVKLPNDYPFSAPRVKFMTPIEHVNINKNGDICLDILKNGGWSASQNIKTVMISIRVLLSCPNPDDPFNSELAELYRKNEQEYINRIKKACEKYARE
ncbi:putative ubiquitin-conjugating enzyme E2 [Tupanvirus soda lake]|uniref:E2 ubiquitin-conjugating enzyme n=2 Tax=Tupanvirus TaxID=2094720 RepID=A0A6N1NN83_9VIRU|nr:putative ubiquitin-conjugating enzyme E2 [Tupanvirus soda lake]QKU35410.1 putative ubiquitin-conjugating enzyme E2 [Tupanvirus soda lake]